MMLYPLAHSGAFEFERWESGLTKDEAIVDQAPSCEGTAPLRAVLRQRLMISVRTSSSVMTNL